MPRSPGHFSQLRGLQNVTCVLAMLLGAALIGMGVLREAAAEQRAWLVAGGGFILFLAIMFMTFAPLVFKIEAVVARQQSELRDIHESLGKLSPLLGVIADNTRLSDAARALSHRDQEIDSLRSVIRADIRDRKWEAALYLVDEMERRFGVKEEAEQLREEIDDARNIAIESKLNEAVEMIESHFAAHDWERAQHEIDRLLQALPDNARVLVLQDRMKVLKEEHKQELKVQWEDAVRRSDTDHAIDILKELDQYLSRAEAKELHETARTVFKDKLLQLGIQFRFAVTEKRWHDALEIGLELIRDFPNARMANEVREVMDMLRERARISGDAGADIPEVSA